MNIRRPHPERTAFSLVEVLIAILVLSLGLLGLGAVFPTILRQQRLATQTTLGLTAQNASNPILASNPAFGPTGRGWHAMRLYAFNNQSNDGDWVSVEPDDGSSGTTHLGSYILQAAPPPWDSNPNDVYLPLSQRLYPLPYSTEVEPRFVWDIAVRLTGDPTSADYPYDSPLLVAVFLRPIDTGIKTSFIPGSPTDERRSLVATLIDSSLGARHRRNPVSVSDKGEPTFDGRRDRSARYAVPIVGDINGPGTSNILDVCILDQLNPNSTNTDLDVAVALFSVPGQRFIDRAGNLHTVTQVDTNRVGSTTTQVVHFSPEVAREDVNADGNVDKDDVNPVIFLPTATTIEPAIFTIKP